jgi:phage FluMu protein Com
MDVATHFTILLEGLEEICPKGRELSIVRTKLEEASFYAKKSLVHFEGNRA